MAHFAELDENNIVLRVVVVANEHEADGVADAFYGPQPYPSWSLDDAYVWQAPVPYPDDGMYQWDEAQLNWVSV